MDSEPFALSEHTSEELESTFITECCNYLKRTRIAWLECGPGACFHVYPKGGTTLRRGNYILDLQHTDEELMKTAHSKQRNMIRRGEKEGVSVCRAGESLLADYKWLEDQVWERNEMPNKSMEYYQTMVAHLPTTCSVAVAYREGTPQAGGIFLYTTPMAYYHHGASGTDAAPGAHAYLMWEQFRYLRDLGVKKLNFVGYRPGLSPTNKGYTIQHFKERFGGELVETYFFRFICHKSLYFLYRLARMVLNHETYADFFDTQSKEFPELNP